MARVFNRGILLVVAMCISQIFISSAMADQMVIGKIGIVQPYTPQGLVYVTLQGNLALDGGGCNQINFVGLMTDANFMSSVFPIIITAKSTNASIQLRVNGCNGPYPIIVGITME